MNETVDTRPYCCQTYAEGRCATCLDEMKQEAAAAAAKSLKFVAVKDNRGTTYVTPLAQPVVVDAYDRRPASHVMVWYNRETRDWVVSYSCSARGEQVGSSEYVGDREWANEAAADLIANAAGNAVESASLNVPQ